MRGDREDRKRAEQGPLDSAIHEASGRERRCKSLSCSINPTLDIALPEVIQGYTYTYNSFSGVTITWTWISKKREHRPRKGKDKQVQRNTLLGIFELLEDMLHKFASASGFLSYKQSTRSADRYKI